MISIGRFSMPMTRFPPTNGRLIGRTEPGQITHRNPGRNRTGAAGVCSRVAEYSADLRPTNGRIRQMLDGRRLLRSNLAK